MLNYPNYNNYGYGYSDYETNQVMGQLRNYPDYLVRPDYPAEKMRAAGVAAAPEILPLGGGSNKNFDLELGNHPPPPSPLVNAEVAADQIPPVKIGNQR